MTESPKNKTPNNSNSPPKIFYTDIKENNEMEKQQNKLKKYVDNLNSKIDYAKWKQSLVLQYNYLPLKRITEKVEHEKVNYIKKIAQEEKNCAKILSGKQITVQLDLFREFSKKLNEKLQQYQVKIAEEKIRNNMLKEEVQDKKLRLKGKMRQNMQIIRSTLKQEGVRNKEDMITLVKSKSMRDRFTPTSITFDSKRNYTQRKPSKRKMSAQSKREHPSLNDQLFRECYDRLVASVQSMKTSDDIQSGIYLDIMDRGDKSNYSSESKYGSRSKISQTIHNRFGSSHLQQVRNSKDKANFQMDWETFKQLNWKQIMGIVLVKDKNSSKIKQLLRYK